jgi:maltooligosyltrehalose trehalohydrolase
MQAKGQGFHESFLPGVVAGTRYRFELPDGRRIPDPASRFQPDDVNGPSELIDPAFRWQAEWDGLPWENAVLYELHLGAFTPQGGFRPAIEKLDQLAALGVTAVEIMPVSDFGGRRNWGYDGVLPYAPDSSYGRPEDFRAFVDAAHALGVAVLLDVVYNHFGPEGNYLPFYAPDFFTNQFRTPWGDAVNFALRPVRDYFIENAEYWIEEFGLDGLRFDAAQAIKDNSQPHILDEIAERLRSRFVRPIHLLLEDEDNEVRWLERTPEGPKHYTAQWNDDAHHVLHVAATGERSGYYAAYGATELIGRALAQGFAYQGEMMEYRGRPRGAPSAHLPPEAFVAFIQNHDQIGNRAFGERIDALAPPEVVRALASVYLIGPQIPMIFMGEEGAEIRPFLFFCDFAGDLGEAVRKGRREEFRLFPEFSDPARVAKIPDPLDEATFLASKIDWERFDETRWRDYQAMLATRRRWVLPLLRGIRRGGTAKVLGEGAVRVAWSAGARPLVLDANLSLSPVAFPPAAGDVFWTCGDAGESFGPWSVRWSLGPA